MACEPVELWVVWFFLTFPHCVASPPSQRLGSPAERRQTRSGNSPPSPPDGSSTPLSEEGETENEGERERESERERGTDREAENKGEREKESDRERGREREIERENEGERERER